MPSFFSSGLNNFELESQLKTLIYVVDEKQVGIKDSIKIISSLNPSQKLLVAKVIKLVKLTLTVPITNTVKYREILCLTLRRVKFYLRSYKTQEPPSSCLILATCK